MHRVVSGLALLLLAAVPAVCAQEPAFFGGRPALRYEQSAGAYHIVYPCQTGLEFNQPTEIKGKLVGLSEEALCWPVMALRMKKMGASFEPSPMVSGRLAISRSRLRFLPNEGKDAQYFADFAVGEVQFQHKPGDLMAFFGNATDMFYKFGFANFCATCAAGSSVPATKNLKQVDEEIGQVQASLKDFEGVSKTIADLTSKNRIEIRSGNQPDRGDAAESANLYSEMNTRLAGFCGEPAKGCFQSFAKYEACKSASWDAECGPRPMCTESCFATLHDLQRLDAAGCVQADQQAASLVPDWSAAATNNDAGKQPPRGSRAGYLEIQMPPGPNPPSAVGCGVNASRIRASTAPPSFGVAGMEGLGGAGGVVGGLYATHGTVPKDIKNVAGDSDLKVVTGPNGLKRVYISAGVAQGMLLKKVVPVYPPIAKAARIQGTVVLQGVVGKAGDVDDLHVVAGPPLLQGAAVDAVKQWQYRPYLLNGGPVEVVTTINVIFSLGDGPPAAGALVPAPAPAPAPAKAEP